MNLHAKQQLHKKIDLNTLTPAQARVEIAKDVLAGLQLNVIRPSASHTYFTADIADGTPRDLRAAFGKRMVKNCHVCGIGALFVAKVCRLDNIETHGWFSGDRVREELAPWFTREQLALIEVAFEVAGGYYILSHEAQKAAEEFGRQHINDRSRMVAIMENIIKNRGEFKP